MSSRPIRSTRRSALSQSILPVSPSGPASPSEPGPSSAPQEAASPSSSSSSPRGSRSDSNQLFELGAESDTSDDDLGALSGSDDEYRGPSGSTPVRPAARRKTGNGRKSMLGRTGSASDIDGGSKKVKKPGPLRRPSTKRKGKEREGGDEGEGERGMDGRGDGDQGDEEEDDEDDEPEPQEDAAFNRLAGFVSNAAGQDLGLGGGFQEEMAIVDDEELPEASKRLKKTRRPHKATHEIQRLLGQANMTYVTAGPEEAIEIFLEVIRNDPYVHAAWTSLASCYEELGNRDAARQMRFFAAHVDSDEHKWKNLAGEFREGNQMAQCLYCLRKALLVDPRDVECLWEMASIYQTQKEAYKAISVFKRILRADPNAAHNLALLMELYPLISETNQIAFGAQAFREGFDYHTDTYTTPDDQTDEANRLTLEHIVILVDLLLQLDSLEESLAVIRRGQRWLQGRGDQHGWDAYDDDREYDPPGINRDGTAEDEEVEGYGLDINLRHRLALLRLRLGNDMEATIHIDEMLQLDVVEHQALFIELGDALMKRELWEKALECYASIQECDDIDDDLNMILSIGICHHMLKDYNPALEAIRWVVAANPDNLEAKLKLANLLEDMGQKAEALDIVTEVLKIRATQDGQTSTRKHTSKFDKGRHALDKHVLEDQMRQKMVALWEDVNDAEASLELQEAGALDRFIYCAGTLVENHRLARRMFSKDRGTLRVLKGRRQGKKDLNSEAAVMQDRLERAIGFEAEEDTDDKYVRIKVTEFHGIKAEEWLTLVVKYCCVLMVKNEEEVAMDILEHIIWSALFNSRRCEIALRLTTIACAMRLKAYDKIIDNCKRLAQIHQFRPRPILLMQWGLNGGGEKANIIWQNIPLQKFIHREMMIWDDAARGIPMRYNETHKRWTQSIKVGYSRRLGDEMGEEGVMVDEEEDVPDPEMASRQTGRGGGQGTAKARKSMGAVANGQKVNGKSRKTRTHDDDGDEDDEHDIEDNEEEEQDDEYAGLDQEEAENGSAAGAELDKDQDGNKIDMAKPTMLSPHFNVIYGQYMLSTKSFGPALFYFFRAYEKVPYDPYICLMISQAYFGRALNRQADNRNYMIAQGLAFLTKYRKLSPKDVESQEEVEYNYGRAFHGLGVPHLAVVHYERVLDSVQSRLDTSHNPDEVRRSSMACQAAHNLMLLYASTGSTELVKQRSKWLAI